MMRWKLTIEYNGSDFVGWQRQKKGISVQQTLEEAIERFTGETVRLHVAGRTDAGVHAFGQVAHVDIEKHYEAHEIRNAINFYARPNRVAVVNAEEMNADFHARFDAKRRYYRYVIFNRSAPNMISIDTAWHVGKMLDLSLMEKAAEFLVGRILDFTSFRAQACQAKSPIRSIDSIRFKREGNFIYIDLIAPSFLHHQVRNIVGTFKKIGEGNWPVESMMQILEKRDRAAAGPTAPPQGLFFIKVDY